MKKWGPMLYDCAMAPLENVRFRKIRETLINRAKGRVLEVGSGTGVNFPLYHKVTRVDAIEPNPSMKKRAIKRLNQSKVPIHMTNGNAEILPYENNTFDTAVATLVFCTIPDPQKAIDEIQRVCRPNSSILLFEHVKMNQSLLGKTQDILTPVWKRVCDGCHLNRNTLELLKASNIEVVRVESYYKGLFLVIEGVNRKDTDSNRKNGHEQL